MKQEVVKIDIRAPNLLTGSLLKFTDVNKDIALCQAIRIMDLHRWDFLIRADRTGGEL